jgi:hypothetical protein
VLLCWTINDCAGESVENAMGRSQSGRMLEIVLQCTRSWRIAGRTSALARRRLVISGPGLRFDRGLELQLPCR